MSNHSSDPVAQLTSLGFGEYEARAYVTLLRYGPLSGYDVSKHSGVPRPNVYAVLQKLQERGAVSVLSTQRGARYTARPAAELLERLERSYLDRLQAAGSALAELTATAPEPVATAIGGEAELIGRARWLIEGATAQVVVAVAPATARLLDAAVARAAGRGVSVTTLCLRACPTPCGACHGALFRQQLDEPAYDRWLLVLADDREVLAADLSRPGDEATGICTRHPALVRLAAGAVRDGIAAAEIVRSLGAGLIDSVDMPAQQAIAGAALADSGHRSWLERIRTRLHGG